MSFRDHGRHDNGGEKSDNEKDYHSAYYRRAKRRDEKLLREIKEKTGKKASEAILAALKYFNDALNKVLFAGGKNND